MSALLEESPEIHPPDPWRAERVMGVLGFIGGVLAVVFTLGVNWQKVSAVEVDFQEHVAAEAQTYARQDVIAERDRRVEEQYRQLSIELREVKRLLVEMASARRAAPTP